jgi:hypothetical protein
VSSSGRDDPAGRAVPVPRPTAPPSVPQPARLDDALLVDVLARLAAAGTPAAVAAAGLPLLLQVTGVRAAAVVLRDRSRVVVVGSAGYDCGTMAPGAVLPLDAGLPVTEAVRTGRPVARGSGPGWIAVPFGGRAGALLLSLVSAPPSSSDELARLDRMARGLGDALVRAVEQEHEVSALAVVRGSLAAGPVDGEVASRVLPHHGSVGGDVTICLPDDQGGRWLVVADVCGAGLPAAVVARTVQAAFTALAPVAGSAPALLSGVDRAVRRAAGTGLFVTALVAHQQGRRLHLASAGHPPPLLLHPDGRHVLAVPAGLPLALESDDAGPWPQVELDVPDGAVLLLHTDGLVDRRGRHGPRSADPLALVGDQALDDLEALADGVLAAAAEVGDAGDDVTLLLAHLTR